jgi:UDP-2-acetamido-2,6-beta-L-arabino-hexul-4-ose reductase
MDALTPKTILVTGSEGFVGKNLRVALQRRPHLLVLAFDLSSDRKELPRLLLRADIIYHLAGVNRPERIEEFAEGNAGLTREIVDWLRAQGRAPRIVMPSSAQAMLDNPYGVSKREAEDALFEFARESGADVRIYRLPGVFGKWSRPNYNTVVATFCHNIARGSPITISDPSREIELVYIDDVVEEYVSLIDAAPARNEQFCRIDKTFKIALGELAKRIESFKEMRRTLELPDFSDGFTQRLYATYLSFLPEDEFACPLDMKTDARGDLFELIKSDHCGQIFVSRTKPGITRGNHYHDTKVEKFCVVKGKAIIRFRHVAGSEVIRYPVSDERIEVVDIPPGYTHHIENVGDGEMIVLFWADQRFDPARPDTYFLEV